MYLQTTLNRDSRSLLDQVSFPLLELPDVVLHQLITCGYLDSESSLFLGATCQALRSIVARQITSHAKWHSLLDEVGTLSKDVVQVKITMLICDKLVGLQAAAILCVEMGEQDNRRLSLIRWIAGRCQTEEAL